MSRMDRNSKLSEMASELSVEDLPKEELRWIADLLGIESAVRLAVEFEGTYFYIPKSVTSHLRKLYCIRHYDGHNARKLAMEMGVSEPTVYKWVAHNNASSSHDQLNMFSTPESAA